MNTPLIVATILTTLAFFAHAIMGDRELKILEPENDQSKNKAREKWTMARCGWQWISIDLLLASIAMIYMLLVTTWEYTQPMLTLLSVYFLLYAIVWVATIAMSKSFAKNYLLLGQWMLLATISALLYWAKA